MGSNLGEDRHGNCGKNKNVVVKAEMTGVKQEHLSQVLFTSSHCLVS